jgi:hypothetical protein
VAAQELGECFEGPGDGLALVDREVAERFDEVAPAGSARPAYAKHLCAVDPLQRPERPLSLGGDRAAVGLPGVEGLAGRQSGGATAHPDRCLVSGGRGSRRGHRRRTGRRPRMSQAPGATLQCRGAWITEGQDSYRLAQATAGKGVKPLT